MSTTTDDDIETGYFAPTTIDKPLPRTRPGPWACQPRKDHPRGRPEFTLHSNPMPLQLRARSHPVRRTFDTAMTWCPAALVALVAAGAYFFFIR